MAKRLDIIRNHHDGFVIAEKDLELRGAGEVLGTRQTGEASFKIADLMRDQRWFGEVNKLAALMQKDEYSAMREALIQNWVGYKQGYTEVGWIIFFGCRFFYWNGVSHTNTFSTS